MYNCLINHFYPPNMFDIFLGKYISTEDGIAEKLLLFKLNLLLFTTYSLS